MAIVLAIVGAAAIGGASASSDSTDGDARTIVLVAQGDQFTERATMDLGVKGLSQGDRFVFNDNIFRDGKRVGIDGGECTVVRKDEQPGAATYLCLHTWILPGGQISGQGLFRETTVNGFDREVFAITGGTGRYRGARGEYLDERLSPTSFRYTLRLHGIKD